jgi:hypothetical protein
LVDAPKYSPILPDLIKMAGVQKGQPND